MFGCFGVPVWDVQDVYLGERCSGTLAGICDGLCVGSLVLENRAVISQKVACWQGTLCHVIAAFQTDCAGVKSHQIPSKVVLQPCLNMFKPQLLAPLPVSCPRRIQGPGCVV